jgi:hypothetical protein
MPVCPQLMALSAFSGVWGEVWGRWNLAVSLPQAIARQEVASTLNPNEESTFPHCSQGRGEQHATLCGLAFQAPMLDSSAFPIQTDS